MTLVGSRLLVLSGNIFSHEILTKTLLPLLRGPLYSIPYLAQEKCFQLSASLYYLK